MAPIPPAGTGITAVTTTTSTNAMAADLNAIQNRVAVALAKRERLIKSWTVSSSNLRAPLKTQEELDAEDADLFNPTPAGLGLGAPIPKELLDGDIKRKEITSNNKLRHILLGNRGGLQASKPRDEKEKADSTKRGLDEDSSDDDQGRSSLGKAKKSKTGAFASAMNSEVHIECKHDVKSTSQDAIRELSHVYCSQSTSSGISTQKTPVSLEKHSSQIAKARAVGKIKPLVDYDSEEESDRESKKCMTTPTAMENKSASHTSNSFRAHSKAGLDVHQKDGKQSRSETIPQVAKGLTSKQSIVDPVKKLLLNSTTSSKWPASKCGFSYSPVGGASTTESEPSDMETAIPSALVPDVVGQTSFAASNTISPIETKRAKNRQKRQRKKEREQQRKAMESSIASTSVEKSSAAMAGGVVAAKKIKDRLLDANGK